MLNESAKKRRGKIKHETDICSPLPSGIFLLFIASFHVYECRAPASSIFINYMTLSFSYDGNFKLLNLLEVTISAVLQLSCNGNPAIKTIKVAESF